MAKETISRKTFAKGVTAGVIIAASLGLLQAGEYALNSGSSDSASTSGLTFTPGSYTASAAGIESDVTVTCTFDESSITDLAVDVSGETPGLGADIGDEITEQILTAQSTDVDGISGATVTSDAVKAAVADCIAQASGEAPVQSSDSGEAASTEIAETETDSSELLTEEAAAEVKVETPAETETEQAVTEAESENAEASSEEAVGASASGTTYTASAAGIESDVTVTMSFDGAAITDVIVDVSGETAGIGAEIGDEVTEQLLTAQSADIDGVSGATVTSDAVRTAAADCIAQASAGAAASEASEEETDAETEAGTEEAAAETEAVTEETAAETEAATEETVTEAESESEEAVAETEAGTEETVAETEADSEEAVAETEAGTEETVAETESESEEAVAETEAESEEAVTEAEADSEQAETEEAAAYTPGIYTASAAGISSDVTVTATFDETSIIEIDVDVSGETAGIGAMIDDDMEARILEAQTWDVDGVSGATITSDAIKAALADCIEQALSASEQDTAEEAEADVPGDADGTYIPGTYSATAAGISSDVTVTITFDENSIVAIDVDVSGETAGIGAMIDDDMEARILEAQTWDVDGISGATVSSDAVKEAASACIEQAAE